MRLDAMKRTILAIWAASALAGCADEALPASAPVPPAVVAGPTATPRLQLGLAAGSGGQRLVGAEYFELSVRVRAAQGRFITAYGLSSPYETVVRPVDPPLPIAIAGGAMVLRRLRLTEVPRAGEYPLQLWLINEAGQASNPVRTSVFVQ